MTQTSSIQKVAIVGGQASGWICAAVLANAFPKSDAGSLSLDITVVDIPGLAPQVAAESTTADISIFHKQLGIDEATLMSQCQASFKLATEYVDWQADSYMHGLGRHGSDLGFIAFHQLAAKMRADGSNEAYEDYSLCASAARNNKFAKPDDKAGSVLATLAYALHLDLGLYTQFMKQHATNAGVKCISSDVSNARLNKETGHIQALLLENGERLEADLFLDCSEQKASLIDGVMKTGFKGWSHWFPCDSSLEVSAANTGDPQVFTRFLTQPNGWMQVIPLQSQSNHRFFYESATSAKSEIEQLLLEGMEEHGVSELLFSRLRPGIREKFWTKNCVAIGHSAACHEPLTSTYIHQCYSAVIRLLQLFPLKTSNKLLSYEYNRLTTLEHENLRDYALLPYALNNSKDTAFWVQRQSTVLPQSLADRIELFSETGRIVQGELETYSRQEWVSLLIGLGCWPKNYDPIADMVNPEKLATEYEQMRMHLRQTVAAMPGHYQVLSQYCPANTTRVVDYENLEKADPKSPKI